MRNYTIIFIAFSAFFVAACSSIEQTNQPQNTINAVNQTNQAVVETKPAEPALSPTDTLKALNEASKRKDPAAIKSYLSAGTLALLDESAAEQNKPVDELLKEDKAAPFHELPKILGETVSGETADVEVENALTKETEKIPLVKENGMWKVAIDVYLKNFEAEIEKETQKPETKK